MPQKLLKYKLHLVLNVLEAESQADANCKNFGEETDSGVGLEISSHLDGRIPYRKKDSGHTRTLSEEASK
jgi:hypothetical protein